jgi:hypothetical protein
MEADLESRDELIDRLRARVAEAEKQTKESQKRYAEQVHYHSRGDVGLKADGVQGKVV